MKILSLLVVFFLLGCESLAKDSSYVHKNDVKMDTLKSLMLESNFFNGQEIEYKYECKGFEDVDFSEFTGGSGTSFILSRAYTLYDWGIASNASCETRIGFSESKLNNLFLESCAKLSGLETLIGLQDSLKKNISLDYIQWCVESKSENHMTVRMLIKYLK